MRKSSLFMLGVSFFALAAVASASNERVAPVSVKSAGSALTVRITGPTTLRAVLEAVCEQAEARCELQPGAAEVPAQPGDLSGTWSQVVDELLKSSGISYAATPQAPGRAAYLFVEAPGDSHSGRATDVELTGGGDVAVSPAEGATTPSEPEPLDVAQGTDATDPADAVTSDPAPSAAANPAATIVDAVTASAQAAGGQQFAMTPFADAQGKPLMARTNGNQGSLAAAGAAPGWTVLPFSDSSGNPLVVQVTNPPVDVTPFAGPDGEAWPAPPPQPGQKLQYPIPPTHQPVPKTEK
jgi:hypothetical protein